MNLQHNASLHSAGQSVEIFAVMQRQHSIAKSDVAQAMLHQMHESKHKQEADQASLEDAKAEVADANLEVAALKSLLESAQVRTVVEHSHQHLWVCGSSAEHSAVV